MGTAAAKKQEKGTVINGVLLDKAKEAIILKSLKAQKLEGKKGEPLDTLVMRLAMHFKEKGNGTDDDPKELMECDAEAGGCGGGSFRELAACPFCGMVNDDAGSGSGSDSKDDRPSTPSALAGTNPKAQEPEAARKTSAIASAKKLDEAVAEVQRLKGAYAGSNWDLGKKVLEIFTEGTWKLRLDDNGKARWKGFDSFCHAELGLLPNQAFDVMDLAKNFTREQMLTLGKAKLKLIAQAPEEDKQKLLEQAAKGGKDGKGATKREIEAEVRRIKKEKGHRRASRGGQAKGSTTAGAGGGRKPKPAEDKVTVSQMVGKVTVKLFQKPANVKKFDPKELKRAKTVGKVPWGRNVLLNGVVQSFTVRENGAGELELVVETAREEAPEPTKAAK
jgi:hypothetical protein